MDPTQRRTLAPIVCTLAALGGLGAACVPDPPAPPTYTPEIAGETLWCNDYMCIPVLTVFDPNLDDIGRALPGTFQSPPSILLNSRLLEQLPDAAQLFWYGHECAHHVLGHAASYSPYNESNADCWSVQTLASQGLVDRDDVIQTASYLLSSPGTPWGHLPGPARASLLVGCYDAVSSIAVVSGDAQEQTSWQ